MKLFSFLLLAVLVGSCALLFVLKGPDGKPILSVDQMVDDTVAASVPAKPMEMYRWKNEQGIWEFGESPPEQVVAAKLRVDNSRTTTMGAEWNVAPVISEARARSGSDAVNFQMPSSVGDAYRAAPELMGAAQRAAATLNDRQAGMDEQLDSLMQQLKQQ